MVQLVLLSRGEPDLDIDDRNNTELGKCHIVLAIVLPPARQFLPVLTITSGTDRLVLKALNEMVKMANSRAEVAA